MKRSFWILCALLFALALPACGGGGDNTPDAAQPITDGPPSNSNLWDQGLWDQAVWGQ